jgi:hypothetical protein
MTKCKAEIVKTIPFRGIGYPALWPSESCREPLDVSKNFTFEVIDGILSGGTL